MMVTGVTSEMLADGAMNGTGTGPVSADVQVTDLTMFEQFVMLTTWYGIGAPAFFANILVDLVILLDKQFHTSGYALLVSLSICETTCLFIRLFLSLPISFLHLTVSSHYLEEIGSLLQFSYYSSVVHLLFISINRYVAVVHYSRYNQVFTGRTTAVFIFLAWLIGLLTRIPRMLGLISFTYVPREYTWHYEDDRPDDSVTSETNGAYANFTIVYVSIVVVISSVVYMVSATFLRRKRRNERHAFETSTAERTEESLFVQFLVVTGVFGLTWIVNIIVNKLHLMEAELHYSAHKWINFGFNTLWITNYSINVYVYLARNYKLRRAVVARYCCCPFSRENDEHIEIARIT